MERICHPAPEERPCSRSGSQAPPPGGGSGSRSRVWRGRAGPATWSRRAGALPWVRVRPGEPAAHGDGVSLIPSVSSEVTNLGFFYG